VINRSATAVLALAVLSNAPVTVHAQAYPAKPVRCIVPFPPGGGTDLVARAIAPKLMESGGIQLIVDNRPGGGTVVGAELAARAAPDGYTIFWGTNTSHAINPNLYPKLSYDAIKDFAPITRIASSPYILIVHPSLPVRTVKDLVALARARPGQLNFGSPGNGTPGHLAGIMMNEAAGINMVHIPYKGAAYAMTALVSGEIHLIIGSLTSALPLVKSGRVRAIAMSSAQRSPINPAMPTIAESGYPGFEAITWYGVFAPAGTSPSIVARLNAEFVKVLSASDFKAWLMDQGADAAPSSPDELSAFVKSEIARYAPLVRKSGMRPD